MGMVYDIRNLADAFIRFVGADVLHFNACFVPLGGCISQ
jgi:hypothetical protein